MSFAMFRVSDGSRRLILAVASSLFLLAASSVPSIATLDTVSEEMIQPAPFEAESLSSAEIEILSEAEVSMPDFVIEAERPATLSAMIARVDAPDSLFRDDEQALCLARAVYFEARGEPLEGQLAVAQAIINRTASARYPDSICAVVHQPGQFTFRHGQPVKQGTSWQNAKAIAHIASQSLWTEVAPKAISFHAAYVRPAWRGKTRVAQIGRHIFYR
jgi:N-acetylmuramoyl-L-alanine amidase